MPEIESGRSNLRTLVVHSEAEAYALLKSSLDGKVEPWGHIRFEGWPVLTVYLKGEKFDKTLTPPVMRSLLEYQKAIYHAYALSRYGNPTKRLSDDEKAALEIQVKVEGGSSELSVDFQELAVKFIEQIGGKMEPNHVLTIVLSFLVLYFGTSALRTYLDDRKEVRLKELNDATQIKAIEALQYTSAQETKRMEILTQALSREGAVEDLAALAYDAHTDLVKAVAACDEGKVNGVPISGKAAITLVQNARRDSHEVRLDGRYVLTKLDWSNPDRFRVRVFNVDTKQELDADVQDDTLTGDYKKLLQEAEWARSPVKLQVNAVKIGDQYKNATILKVEVDEARKKGA